MITNFAGQYVVPEVIVISGIIVSIVLRPSECNVHIFLSQEYSIIV